MIGQTRFTPAFMENTMLHGSWFLPQLYHATSVGGKNCGEAKAEKRRRAAPLFRQSEAANGVPGFPRPHDLAARQAARSNALYRPGNSMIKCPARHVGPDILAGGKRGWHVAARSGKAGCGFSMAGWYVSLTITTVLTAERRCLNYALCDFTF